MRCSCLTTRAFGFAIISTREWGLFTSSISSSFTSILEFPRFLSVEIEEQITKRIEFNKPFRMIETRIGPIGAEIPTLSRDLSHILWLDYDGVISEYMLQDIVLATSVLRNQSLVLVTVDLEPPGGAVQKSGECTFCGRQVSTSTSRT